MALMLGKVYSNTGTPSNADGENGDIFMQLDGLKTTYRKEGGVWTAFGNQLGTIPEFLKGVGVPSNAVGTNNQYYREVNTDAIYEKQAGVWTEIGSWTSLEITNLLQSNGIGANLTATNHIANIDGFAEAGDEGYYDGTTLGVKPSVAGFCKVWRGGSTLIGQRVQTTTNLWATRFSTDGATWGSWRIGANQDGDASRTFKAAAGVAADDVVVVGQFPSREDLLEVGDVIRTAYAQTTGVALAAATLTDIVTATVACTAGVNNKFRVTAKIPFSVNSGDDPIAQFVLNSTISGNDIDKSYHWDRDMSNLGMTGVSVLQREVTLVPAGTTATFTVRGLTNAVGTAGPTWGIVASYCTLLIEVIKT